MSLRALPKVQALQKPKGFDWDAPSSAFSHWADLPHAAAEDGGDASITIYDVIGEDPWSGGGFTARRMSAALRAIGPKPVAVKINSPGGDVFEAIAIYNQLREHPAKVSVEVMGIAASAASIIAMAGDHIAMGRGSMMMIHKAWGLVVGNDDDFSAAAELFGTINNSMAEIYAARTGLKQEDVLAMLSGPTKASDGTWLTASDAVDKKFADALIDEQPATDSANAAIATEVLARRRAEAALADKGVPRKERAAILNSLSGQRDATRLAAPRDASGLAGDPRFAAEAAKLLATLKR